jgi:hypothetical protein
MTYKYMISYWTYPKSGMELIEQNSFMVQFKKALKSLPLDDLFQQAVDNLKVKEGMTLKQCIVETDNLFEDCKEEILNEIRKHTPEAEIYSHSLVQGI